MFNQIRVHWLLVLSVLVGAMLACASNTPVASVATARPTRTPLPTFTLTPIPPSPTPRPTDTNTPIYTDTPVPTATPIPTDTPVSTDTPAPTDTPTNTPVPPTNTSVPVPPTNTPVPTPVAQSPLATPVPTATSEPGTPPGRYELRGTEGGNNCAHVAVTGRVVEKGDDDGVQWVTVQVTGDEDPYKGPFFGKSDSRGDYTVLIGELKNDVDGVEFEVKVVGGPDVDSEDDFEWKADSDCHNEDGFQVMEVDWFWKRD